MKFKIGYYNDKVLCDIMPIDYCHILLGRRWKFDIHAVNDGRMNKYSAWKDGMTYTLLPLIETPDEISCTVKVCMVTRKEFEKDMKKNLVCFSIIPRRPSSSIDDQVTQTNVN